MSDVSNEEQEMARALGQSYWRQMFLQANPDLTPDERREQLKSGWSDARRDYTRIGFQVMRQLRNQGYELQKVGPGKQGAATADD